MPQLKELLVEELQDLLHAETQLVAALPKNEYREYLQMVCTEMEPAMSALG